MTITDYAIPALMTPLYVLFVAAVNEPFRGGFKNVLKRGKKRSSKRARTKED